MQNRPTMTHEVQDWTNKALKAWPEKTYLDRLLVKSAKKSERQEKRSVEQAQTKTVYQNQYKTMRFCADASGFKESSGFRIHVSL